MPAPRKVLALGVLLWVVGALYSWSHGTPLGHDEAQYGLAAKDLLAGQALRWPYLSIGMVVTSMPAVLAGADEWTLRVAPMLFGVAMVLAAHRVARLVVDELAAACVPLALAVTIAFARRSAENLSDVPATACLLMAIAVVIEELLRPEGPRWRLVAAAPWAAGAFYLRYGSLLPLLVIAAVALLAGLRGALRRPGPCLATVGVAALLAVPHFWMATQWTGAAMGILHESANTIPAENGLRTYLTANPFTYYGTLATPLLIAGLLSVLKRRDRRSLMVWAIAVADIVVVGMTTLAQSRYIFLGLALLLVLGVREVIDWLRARRHQRAAWAVAALLAAAAWAVVMVGLHHVDHTRRKTLAPVMTASALIRAQTHGQPCYVLGRRTTLLEWYSGCQVELWVSGANSDRPIYVVVQPGKPEQPDLDAISGKHELVLDQPGVVQVTRIAATPGAPR